MSGGTKVTEPSNVCVLDLKVLKYCYTRQGQPHCWGPRELTGSSLVPASGPLCDLGSVTASLRQQESCKFSKPKRISAVESFCRAGVGTSPTARVFMTPLT